MQVIDVLAARPLADGLLEQRAVLLSYQGRQCIDLQLSLAVDLIDILGRHPLVEAVIHLDHGIDGAAEQPSVRGSATTGVPDRDFQVDPKVGEMWLDWWIRPERSDPTLQFVAQL